MDERNRQPPESASSGCPFNNPDQPGWARARRLSSTLKKIPLDSEARNLEFRAEFFNAFNTPSFANPGLDAGTVLPDPVTGRPTLQADPTLGQITSTTVAPRVIQFALKFYF